MICDTAYRFEQESRAGGLSVCYSGREACTPGHSFGPAVRDHYIIHYILRGKGTFEQDGRQYPLGPSDAFLITPYHTASYRADESDPWEYVWIAFRGSDVDGILARCGLSRQTPVFHYRLETPLERRIPVGYSAAAANTAQDYEALGELYGFFSLLMRSHEMHSDARASRGTPLQQAIAYVEANYFNDFSVEDLAAHVSLSRSQLYRVFKNSLGMSPQSYILQCRLTKARYLVCNTALSVAEIALSCGFTDQSYFTRCFRSQYGASPLAYRVSDDARPLQR